MDSISVSPVSGTSSTSNVQDAAVSSDVDAMEGGASSLCSLNMKWTFGQSCFIPLISLHTVESSVVFFISGHVGVLFDWVQNTQLLLQGHRNNIACIAATKNKKWIATADKGPNNMLIVWDAQNGLPLKTVYDCYPLYGIDVMEFSDNAKFLTTISADPLQVIGVWDWTSEDDNPLISVCLKNNFGKLHHIAFHPSCSNHFAATGERKVVFFHLTTDGLKYFVPAVSEKDFKRAMGRFTQTAFQVGCETVLTATTLGGFLLWGSSKSIGRTATESIFVLPEDRQVLRLIHPLRDQVSITVLLSFNNYIVTGDEAGHVHFFDKSLKLVHWFKDFKVDAINAVSFKYDPSLFKGSLFTTESSKDTSSFPTALLVPEFLVGTYSGYCGQISVKDSKITFVHQGCPRPIHAIACHHEKSFLCIADFEGFLVLWDYAEMKLESSYQLTSSCKEIKCIAFDPTGVYLAVGLADGRLLILDSPVLTEIPNFQFHGSKNTVLMCTFSPDANYLAIADSSHAVIVFKLEPEPLKTGRKSPFLIEPKWENIGKQRAHFRPIIDLMFNKPLGDGLFYLFSLGKDRYLAIYDVLHSEDKELKLHSTICVEQVAVPLCMAWYPFYNEENLIIIANDEFKLKVNDVKKEICVKTILQPIHQTPIKRMKLVPHPNLYMKRTRFQKDSESFYLVYSTEEQLGVSMLPADGNSHRSLGVVGHPTGIILMEMSYCGNFIFSVGEDNCVHMWQVNSKAVQAAASLGGKEMVPFYNMLPGGEHGKMMYDLKDYMYYVQIKRYGDDYMETLHVSDHIPIDDLPHIMAALGFYPSEYEIMLLLNDAKFTKAPKKEVNLNDIIKLYINHSPAFGTNLDELSWAFRVLAGLGQDDDEEAAIPRNYLAKCFLELGEKFTEEELSQALMILSNKWPYSDREGPSPPGLEGRTLIGFEKLLPQRITLYTYLTDVLGFELSTGAIIMDTPQKIKV